MHQHRRTDFIETNLKTALLECHEQHLETLGEYRDNFERHKSRLSLVREQNERQKLEIMGELVDQQHNKSQKVRQTNID